VREWPRAATVCNCTGVTRGQIGDAIALGCATIDDVKRDTGASTVCGSCGPLIAELLGAAPERKPAAAFRPLVALSAAAALLAVLTLASPVWPTARSISLRGPGDLLWLDGTWKQVSGFVLLGLSVLAAALFMRKRLGWVRLGQFSAWRLVHAGLGALTLAVLFLHTGFRLGAHLNRWLMLSFLGLAVAGGLAGVAAALEHRLFDAAGRAAQARAVSFWLHLLAFWPLPLLIAAHILTVYFY
jgi:nitrite reductase (NADH) large subunit